ncbi:hypothetical protein BH23ACT6_BH23ACT6_00770 [soil metagenome]
MYALLLLIDCRRGTRVDSSGLPVLLADQDRSRWDQAMIVRGLAMLGKAHAARCTGPYQYQAAIAALHATAPTFEQTDWGAILMLYGVAAAARRWPRSSRPRSSVKDVEWRHLQDRMVQVAAPSDWPGVGLS